MIGTKKDIGTLNDKSISPFRKLIDPYLYYECSSVTGENIQHIFDVITKIAIDPESVKKQIFNEEEEKKPADGTEAKNTDAKEKTTTAQKSAACLLI
ncbi:hypothetical protein TRFO_35961 [Tritrichomonas foetus]|uniref:Uncharacterized protein n=1 Tax=Tritrichomonas foetus TaxID=1144522 RepID=A0A1J4JHM7_9EUKA|nr:hypothetical protein TRFO_35961 [Tritrichomonas foetus]|eukprot:OHS97751.1 hypothetical protein TRFO_35961 [Tritrichomonas foetus]